VEATGFYDGMADFLQKERKGEVKRGHPLAMNNLSKAKNKTDVKEGALEDLGERQGRLEGPIRERVEGDERARWVGEPQGGRAADAVGAEGVPGWLTGRFTPEIQGPGSARIALVPCDGGDHG